MQQDTPDVDRTARTIAESVFAAYMQQAEGGRHSQTEQMLLTRLVEAIRPEVPGATARDIIDAANAALDAWEQQSGEVRGPRVSALNRADGTVGMDVAGA
ncbi:hypothetical protein J2X36_004648 [Methylobacterium sp. BE186]|uniref:hypothetical protein n=1 Tax=Methylobacterium sp. BE186 TaxID=2817715 RepID=UPI002862C461|nr:hypothetical protein [Methylobacterium sp. BE186]MDR7039870.1 hypothetical protein [Methylobacterium sp. BE186]